jgi:hypothetical protein
VHRVINAAERSAEVLIFVWTGLKIIFWYRRRHAGDPVVPPRLAMPGQVYNLVELIAVADRLVAREPRGHAG